MREQAIQFGKATRLAGVTAEPADGDWSERTAVLFLNAGLVHHAGPNRMYVRLARRLAALGLPSLRFDFSGLGDSPPRTDLVPYEQSAVAETREAMDFLEETRGCRRFVLIGLCSGALTALRAAGQDGRVAGAALINTRGGSEQLRNYIKGRAAAGKCARLAWTQPATWLAAVRNQLDPKRGRRLVGTLARGVWNRLGRRRRLREEAAAFAADWQRALDRNVDLLLIYSQWDPGLKFLELTLGDSLRRHADDGRLQLHSISGADHTFTPPMAREKLFSLIEEWCNSRRSPIGMLSAMTMNFANSEGVLQQSPGS